MPIVRVGRNTIKTNWYRPRSTNKPEPREWVLIREREWLAEVEARKVATLEQLNGEPAMPTDSRAIP